MLMNNMKIWKFKLKELKELKEPNLKEFKEP